MIDQKTSHQGYPLPHADNALGFDVARVRDAVTAIDGDVFQATAIATAAKQLVDGVIADTVTTAQAGKVLKLDANAALPASVTGNAATTDKLKTARTVSLSGAASGSVAFDGSANVTIPVTVANDSHTHAFSNLTGKPSTLDGYGIQDAYTKAEIDNLVTGLDMKASVRAATTANIALTGLQTVDGVALAAGNRVLVKDQSTASQNGIYFAASGGWARAADADSNAEVSSGLYVFVEEGAVNDNSGWVLATNGAITIGTTALNFVQFNGLGQVTAGAGLQKNGNTLALADTTVAAGTYGSATQVARVTVNGQGQLTNVTPVTITPDWNSITNRDAAPANHTHTLAIGDGTVQKMTVATNERLNIKAGANVALAFDDAGNTVTISTSGQLSGNVDTATRLQASRTISLSGDATGFIDFDGSANVTLPVNVTDDSHQHTFANLKNIPTTLAEHNITNAYTKAEVDSMVSGLDMKASVRLATTADLGTLNGVKTVDGVTVANGDRVLVKDQPSALQNGIYIANTSGNWSRAADADQSAKVTPGMYVFVEEGAVNDNSGWVLATNGPIVLNTTALAFTQFNGLGQVSPGAGMQKVGNTLGLSNTGVTSGTYGSETAIPKITVDLQGRVTGVQLAAPVGDWNTLQNKPTTLALSGITDVYTKTQVDNMVSGLDMKASVRLATTADLGTLTGTKTVDGVTVANGDRVLVKDQATAAQNGIYIANTAGAWGRAGDADNSAKVTPGMYVFVEEGTVNDNSGWVLATNGAITLGSTALTFVQFNGLGQVTPGTGLQKSGNTIGLQNIVTAAGPVGNGTTVPVVTIDATGRVTALSSAAITPPSWASITGKPTLLNDYGITDAQTKSAELTAESGLNANGMIARTGAGARAVRTLTPGSGITVTNGDGVAGNPTIALATLGAASGPVGSSTTVPTVTIDAHGRVTALSSVAVTPSWASITGKPTLLSDYGITDAQQKSAELTAEAGLSGTGMIARTAAGQRAVRALTSGAGIAVTNGDGVGGNPTVALTNIAGFATTQSFGSPTAVATFTVDQQGRITAAQSVAVAPPWAAISGKPSLLSGYGIADAYTKAEVDAAIQGTLSAAKLFFMQG